MAELAPLEQIRRVLGGGHKGTIVNMDGPTIDILFETVGSAAGFLGILRREFQEHAILMLEPGNRYLGECVARIPKGSDPFGTRAAIQAANEL
ncbi:hypothetical protein AB0C33_01975 [Nonomuraea sp. NPDC048881]|uniref:hypothetical protein n=1 Tax=Nonomuraea sp. NPDC048881 TaxID=3155030 RepID=UPI0033DF06DF